MVQCHVLVERHQVLLRQLVLHPVTIIAAEEGTVGRDVERGHNIGMDRPYLLSGSATAYIVVQRSSIRCTRCPRTAVPPMTRHGKERLSSSEGAVATEVILVCAVVVEVVVIEAADLSPHVIEESLTGRRHPDAALQDRNGACFHNIVKEPVAELPMSIEEDNGPPLPGRLSAEHFGPGTRVSDSETLHIQRVSTLGRSVTSKDGLCELWDIHPGITFPR
mmetsp:Transcript_15072/g.20183  ORF Transcript_15072/g.20183 Transcript_15072/m.20183 type:complete len:220 (+) Transcript_15072:772-1431(+)